MSLSPQFLKVRALRHRYLAIKARKLAAAVSADEVAPRLAELADKLERDAACDEEEARLLQTEEAADALFLKTSLLPSGRGAARELAALQLDGD